jgi:hypothetical protein
MTSGYYFTGSETVPFWLAVILGFLIVARSTRFVNSDVLAEPIRMWADGIEKPGRLRKPKRWLRRPLYAVFGDELSILATCPWCLSIWFALPVAIVSVSISWPYDGDGWYAVLGLWLGYSYLYGLAAINLDD